MIGAGPRAKRNGPEKLFGVCAFFGLASTAGLCEASCLVFFVRGCWLASVCSAALAGVLLAVAAALGSQAEGSLHVVVEALGCLGV